MLLMSWLKSLHAQSGSGGLNRRLAARRRAHSSVGSHEQLSVKIERLESRSLLSAGALDTTFGNGGRVVSNFRGLGTSFSDEQGHAVAVQSDGKIVAGGTAFAGTIAGMARYNADGTPDQTFGVEGQITTYLLRDVTGLYALPNGKILATGPTYSGDFGVVQFLADGTVDATGFGTRGLASVRINNESSTPCTPSRCKRSTAVRSSWSREPPKGPSAITTLRWRGSTPVAT